MFNILFNFFKSQWLLPVAIMIFHVHMYVHEFNINHVTKYFVEGYNRCFEKEQNLMNAI